MWKPLSSRRLRYVLPPGAILAALLTQAVIALVIPKGVDLPVCFLSA